MSDAIYREQATTKRPRSPTEHKQDSDLGEPATKSSRCTDHSLEGDLPADLEYLHDVKLLPLQSQGDAPVTHIAHISDVHIRKNGRFEEYAHVFAKLYEGLRELKWRHPGSIAVIAGDVVHEKCNMHSNGADTAWEFFKSLSHIMPIVVIPGNHDGQVRNTSAKNTLHTLLRDRVSTHPIHLLVPSGAYVYNNVVFGVSSIFDGKFVKAKSIANPERDDVVKIALYHGAVPQVVSDKVFQGYDLTLLGDIHKHQYVNGRQTMAYPGSLISQDFGETDDDHGWIEWNLAERTPTYHHVLNDYAHKSCDFIKGKVLFNGIEYSGAESIIKLLPKKAHLRIMYRDDLVSVNKFEKSLLDALPDLTIKKIPMLQESPPLLTISNSRDLLNEQELHSFIAKSYSLTPAEVIETIEVLDEELKAIDNDNYSEFEEADWTPLVLKFNHLYGYGQDNVIDFTRLKDNGVVGLFAPNAYGKSSVLNILSIAMFGKTTSEGILSHTVINQAQTQFDTSLHFEVGGRIYCVIRRGERKYKEEKPSITKKCYMYRLEPKEQLASCANAKAQNETNFMGKKYVMINMSCSNLKETEKAIEKLVGSHDDFRLTSMCLQNGTSDNSLITMPNANKKKALTKLFKLAVFDTIHGSAVKSKLKSATDSVKSHNQKLEELNNPQKQLDKCSKDMAAATETLELIERQIKELEHEDIGAKKSKHPVPYSEAVVRKKLAELDSDVLEAKIEDIRKDLAAVEHQEAEIQSKISELTLIAENDSIMKSHEKFASEKKARLEKLQSDAENQQRQVKLLYSVSYDGSTHEAIMKEFEELEQQFQASPSSIKGLKFSDKCECCKHNRRMLGQEETGRAMHYSRVKEQLEKMESEKKLFEENQKIKVHNEMAEKNIQAIKRERQEVIESKDAHYELLEQQKKEHAKLTEQMLGVLKKKNQLTSDLQKLKDALAKDKNTYDELQNMLVNIEHNQRCDQIMKKCRDQLKELNEKKSKAVKVCTKLNGELAIINKNVELYNREMKECTKATKEKTMYERLEYITDPKNGYSMHMLKCYIPQMCQGVNSIIGPYMDRDVGMTLEGDTISLLSLPRQRGESPGCPISSFSGMEWFMVDVAIKIVLGKMARVPRSGLMFIDEGISVMDQDRMARIGELFDFLRDHFRYTFVISHIDTVEDHVDMRLYISKEGQFSKINNKFISE